MKTQQVKSAKDLRVYKQAYELAMKIFECSKSWPAEEKYSLTDQIRRSSRSVCANLREAWAKRQYEAHFLSKLTDSASCSESIQLGEMLKIVRQIPGWISPWIADTSAKKNTVLLLKSVRRSVQCSDR